jgi:hypothetical protein
MRGIGRQEAGDGETACRRVGVTVNGERRTVNGERRTASSIRQFFQFVSQFSYCRSEFLKCFVMLLCCVDQHLKCFSVVVGIVLGSEVLGAIDRGHCLGNSIICAEHIIDFDFHALAR